MTALELELAPAPRLKINPLWLRPALFVLIAAAHAGALAGFALYKPPPPPALETLDLSVVSQGDESPENTKDIAPMQAAPPDPVIPPDPTPDPIVEEKPPEVQPPPPPPTDTLAFDPLPPPDDPPPPPTLREAADAINIPLPPAPKPAPKPVATQKPAPKPKPKPRPVTPAHDERNQEASVAHRVGVADGQSQEPGMSRATYGAMLLAAIRSHSFYPDSARARGASGETLVGFTVGAGGGMASVWIEGSSGSADLDSAARQIVRSVAAPAPPGGSFSASTTIRFTLR